MKQFSITEYSLFESYTGKPLGTRHKIYYSPGHPQQYLPHVAGTYWNETFKYEKVPSTTPTKFIDGRSYGYAAQRARGDFIPPLPYTVSAIQKFYSKADGSGYYPEPTGNSGIIGYPVPDYDSVDSKALSNFYAALSNRTELQLGVFLVEIKQTMGLVSNAIATIISVIRALKKGRISDAIKALKLHGSNSTVLRGVTMRDRSKQTKMSKSSYAANAWLELQFGWKPILADIHAAVELIAKRNGNNASPPWFFIRGYAKDNIHTTWPNRSGSYIWTANMTLNRKTSYDGVYTISSIPIKLLTIVGLSDPLSVAWEVVPFSFVLDWFLPIGNYIESFSAERGLKRIALSASVQTDGGIDVVGKSHVSASGQGASGCTFSSFKRVVLTDLPALPFRPVSLIDLVDGWHVTTSLALLKQVFGK